jgi:hypothetical protein
MCLRGDKTPPLHLMKFAADNRQCDGMGRLQARGQRRFRCSGNQGDQYDLPRTNGHLALAARGVLEHSPEAIAECIRSRSVWEAELSTPSEAGF